jgi:chromate reductase
MQSENGRIHLVALPGSLRAMSSNRSVLEAAALLAPAGVVITMANPGGLPHFNPDLEEDGLISEAAEWRNQVAGSDGMILSCPEYAGGIPGAFKNALDWLVAEPGFYLKPVAILGASQRSVLAQDALRTVLRTMSADVVDDASKTLPLLGAAMTAEDVAGNAPMSEALRVSLAALVRHIRYRG